MTIGTELAVRESVRLMNDLTFGDPDMPIRVRNVVVNQVLDSEAARISNTVDKLQSSLIEAIHRNVDQLENPPRVRKVEPRGVYGLKALSEQRLVSS